jgi:hypothetical protein
MIKTLSIAAGVQGFLGNVSAALPKHEAEGNDRQVEIGMIFRNTINGLTE